MQKAWAHSPPDPSPGGSRCPSAELGLAPSATLRVTTRGSLEDAGGDDIPQHHVLSLATPSLSLAILEEDGKTGKNLTDSAFYLRNCAYTRGQCVNDYIGPSSLPPHPRWAELLGQRLRPGETPRLFSAHWGKRYVWDSATHVCVPSDWGKPQNHFLNSMYLAFL